MKSGIHKLASCIVTLVSSMINVYDQTHSSRHADD